MKANQFTKFKKNDTAYAKIVSGLLVLLVSIIIGILIFWSISGNTPGNTASTTEIFTGYTLPSGPTHTGGSNDTATIVTLTYQPYATGNSTISVVCYNSTAATQTSPPVTIAGRQVTVQSGSGTANPAGYNQINVTYTPKIYTDSGSTRTTASTVFNLLPVVAIVVIGSIMIGLVINFGSKKM